MSDETLYFYVKPPRFSRSWQSPDRPFKVPKWVKEQIEKELERKHLEHIIEIRKEYEEEIKKIRDQLIELKEMLK